MPKARVVINVVGPELKSMQKSSAVYNELVKKNNKGKNPSNSSHRGGKYRRKTHKMRKSRKSNRKSSKSRKSSKRTRKGRK